MTRLLDIIFSFAAILLLMPLFIPVIITLRLSGEGKVFYLQERVGKGKKLFKLYKFATMVKDSPQIGSGTVTMKNDPRILPIGKFLRKTKLNELPQLINIFYGHMSIIGPRPQTSQCFEAFTHEMQDIIIKVKPGLSGIGPIVFRDEENILDGKKASLDFYENVIGPYKGEVEAWYINKQSIFTYFLLIFITIWAVLFPKSQIVWKIFRDLPIPPNNLKKELNFPAKY